MRRLADYQPTLHDNGLGGTPSSRGHRVDWKIPSLRDKTPDSLRDVRDLIEVKVKELIASL